MLVMYYDSTPLTNWPITNDLGSIQNTNLQFQKPTGDYKTVKLTIEETKSQESDG